MSAGNPEGKTYAFSLEGPDHQLGAAHPHEASSSGARDRTRSATRSAKAMMVT